MTTPAPRVAVVDDEADVAAYVCVALTDSGCETLGISSPEDAVATMRDFRPDLVCLDLVMPGRTGASIYVDLQSDPLLAGVPVLILSGVDARDELDGAIADADLPPPAGYLDKPLDIEAVVDAVRRIVGTGKVAVTP